MNVAIIVTPPAEVRRLKRRLAWLEYMVSRMGGETVLKRFECCHGAEVVRRCQWCNEDRKKARRKG